MELVAPGFDCTGTGLVVESIVAVWVGDISLTLSAHCSKYGIQRLSVPCHTGPVWMVITRCRGTSLGSIILRMADLVLCSGRSLSYRGEVMI